MFERGSRVAYLLPIEEADAYVNVRAIMEKCDDGVRLSFFPRIVINMQYVLHQKHDVAIFTIL